MESKSFKKFFTDRLLFSSICEYLSTRQILSLAILNHEMYEVVQQHCQLVLKELHLKPSNRKSSIHQMQFYFNRCLRIVRQNKNITQKNENLVTINQPFKFETIKFFQVGCKIACYLTRNQKIRIFRTSQLLQLYQQGEKKQKIKIPQPKYILRNGVKDIRSKSDQCVITKTNGQVSLLTLNKNQQQLSYIQQAITWTTSIPIQSVANSYGYSIFVPESLTNLNTALLQVFNIINKREQNISKEQQNQNKIYLIGRNMINSKQFLIQVPCDEILDICVGSKYAYFISNKNQLFQADLQQKLDNQIPLVKARIFQYFKGINIVKISSGYNFFIALERNLQQLQEWDNQRVVKWLREIGFQSYIKIARYQKLDGKKLRSIQKKYMHNVLGITTQNMQQKFLMSIQQNINKKSNNDQLWGWGKNESGQLGSTSAVFISKPQKIKMNCLNQGQYIDSIFCGWFQTFVRTQKGRIYCTLIKSSKRRKGSQTQKQLKIQQSEQQQTKNPIISDQQEEMQKQIERPGRKKSKAYQNHGKRKKKNHQQSHNNQITKQKNNQKYKEEQSWQEFVLGKAFFIQAFKDILFIVQCPNQNKDQPIKIVKLRTAKAILDKILWSDLNKHQYKVGYMDKDMGLIEASALDLQKFEVKQNSIKYFKKGNTILWDRNNKTDFF